MVLSSQLLIFTLGPVRRKLEQCKKLQTLDIDSRNRNVNIMPQLRTTFQPQSQFKKYNYSLPQELFAQLQIFAFSVSPVLQCHNSDWVTSLVSRQLVQFVSTQLNATYAVMPLNQTLRTCWSLTTHIPRCPCLWKTNDNQPQISKSKYSCCIERSIRSSNSWCLP